MSPMTLRSASLTDAISLPPPISLTSCCISAPASRSNRTHFFECRQHESSRQAPSFPHCAHSDLDQFLVSNSKACIVSSVRIRLHTQELAVQHLCPSHVRDGIDECTDTVIHGELLTSTESGLVMACSFGIVPTSNESQVLGKPPDGMEMSRAAGPIGRCRHGSSKPMAS